MKTNSFLSVGLTFALLASMAAAQAPVRTMPAPPPPQIEIESKFFTIAPDAAARLGLTPLEGTSGPMRGRAARHDQVRPAGGDRNHPGVSLSHGIRSGKWRARDADEF